MDTDMVEKRAKLYESCKQMPEVRVSRGPRATRHYSLATAYFECFLNLGPNLKNMKGNGANIVITPPKSAIAPVFVIALNMGRLASGKAAANELRINELDAIADAAYGRYVCTKKLNVAVKDSTTEHPKGMIAIIGTIQCTRLYTVNANMYSP
jgi:hypothetical protein